MNHACRISRIFSVIVLSLASFGIANASNMKVSVDTSFLSGQIGTIYFDLISGGSSAVNTGKISFFSTDGQLGLGASEGSENGTLIPGPVTLDTTSFFNEWAQSITYGTIFEFNLSLTENGPDFDGTPDAFSLFMVDGNSELAPTTDSTGSNALFVFNIDGTSIGNLNIYTLPNGSQPWLVTPLTAVPVPSAIWLLVTGLIGVSLNARRQVRG